MSNRLAALGRARLALPHPIRSALRKLARNAVDAVPPLARARDARLLRRRMRDGLGYDPDFRNPQTYNERLAHKILYDRDPLLVRTADKIAVRDFVAERIGAEHLVPLIGTYDRAADIPWESLPDRFVLKANHGSGTNLIVRDKASVDREKAVRQADAWLAESHYAWTGEWAYGRIRPRLLIEALLEGDEPGKPPQDYKFYVFRGHTRLVEVHVDRFGPGHRCFFRDTDTLRQVPFRWSVISASREEEEAYIPPAELPEMARIAARLGAGFDHVRVDLYLSDGRILFGELTHYNGNACEPFFPSEYDRVLGDLWEQPDRPWPEEPPA